MLPKTQVERDLEEARNHSYDLWRAEVDELKLAHLESTDDIRELYEEKLQAANDK